MKPLNQKERNNLFFQVIVLYAASVIIWLLLAFGNIQINHKQSELDRKTIDNLKKEMKSSEDFYIQMNKIEDVISDVITSDAKIDLQAKFDAERRVLFDIASKDTARASRLGWMNIIKGYDNRWSDKSKITDSKDYEAQLQTARADRDNWKDKYEQMKESRDNLRDNAQ